MTEPNTKLRAVRISMMLSQDDFARKLRETAAQAGDALSTGKRLVQRWESGAVAIPSARYVRALESLTGMPIDSLGFASPAMARVTGDGAGGHDLDPSPEGVAAPAPGPTPQGAPRGNYSGIWLSQYEYVSSGRGEQVFTGKHFVVLLQHGNRMTVRSLPGASSNPDSPLTIDLTVDNNVVTGTWVEQTAADGYYRGARYYGAIQMLIEPTGRRMAGKWVGFGKEFDINTGPWELRLQDSSTSQATIAKYSRMPE
ncbi:transcriptional regulator with XRE-family HTH domain [Streptomyces sp. SAI-208]|uniref:helix-turn-helix domain-containing protein n=1 Tax=Streptomyces sp. SAI-208 TaxID=2940550 RepID=UPI0024741DD4|nr:helix-turn-helix transcriptional regulator [Streptomyces sp. SAI-208]MDH6610269.1 transcriptional regulator with XRE-family HTH domain [Streptomyces sp. SAI-208]